MPLLDGESLSPALARSLGESLERIPDEDLLIYAQECLRGGFTKGAAVRAHLTLQLEGAVEVPPLVRTLLQMYARGRQFVEALDPSQLSGLYLDLAALLGRERIALALLIDSRPLVRTLGQALASGPTGPTIRSSDRALAAERIRLLVGRWTHDVGVPLVANETPAAGASESEEGALPATTDPIRVAKLEKIVEDQKRRHREELRQLREELDREKKERIEERTRLEVELRAVRENSARVEGALQSERSAREAVVKAAIEEEKRSLLRAWLYDAERLEEGLRQAQAESDLVARAELLLEAQAKADRHSGNRRQALARLEALKLVRDRLSEAAREALQPLPALAAHRERIHEEMTRLETLLGRSASTSAIGAEVALRIESTSSVEQAWMMRPILDLLEEHRLLPPAELASLERALLRRLGLFAETRVVEAPPSTEQSWSLRAALQRKAPVRILIDGHNVALGLPDYFGEATANPEAERRAREKLVQAASQFGERYPGVEIELHLDGARGGVQSPRANVRLEFSGGAGAQRADAVLLGRLHHLAMSEAGRACFLVSDDRRLREDAQREGARCVRTRPFALLLEDAGCLGRGPAGAR